MYKPRELTITYCITEVLVYMNLKSRIPAVVSCLLLKCDSTISYQYSVIHIHYSHVAEVMGTIKPQEKLKVRHLCSKFILTVLLACMCTFFHSLTVDIGLNLH